MRTPVEAIEAFGAVPLRIVPREGFDNSGHTAVRPDGCSFCRAIPSILDLGYYSGLKAIIGGACCDQQRRIMDTLENILNIPVILYGAPRSYDDSSEFFFSEMKEAFARLSGILGTELNMDVLSQKIAARNKLKAKVVSLRNKSLLPNSLLHKISSTPLPPDEIIRFLDENCTEPADNQVRLMLAGSIPGYWELEVIEETGAVVAADATCMGDRFFHTLADENIDPLKALYKTYIDDNFCPHRRPQNKLIEYLKQLAAQRDVQGVVFLTLKYCHPWGLSHVRFKEELGLPLVRIDDDLSSPAVGSFKTRVGAFVEMINAGSKVRKLEG